MAAAAEEEEDQLEVEGKAIRTKRVVPVVLGIPEEALEQMAPENMVAPVEVVEVMEGQPYLTYGEMNGIIFTIRMAVPLEVEAEQETVVLAAETMIKMAVAVAVEDIKEDMLHRYIYVLEV
jgi:hypothetical protein